MSIHVENIVKMYGQQKAVDDISFTINKGEIVGFLGPNGAGKSTTMKLITSFIPPQSGNINVCGIDVLTNSIESRKKIGYLPEHNPLYLDLYVHEFLEFIGRVYNYKSQFIKRRIVELIETCGLQKEQNKKIGALSKGYRQRVGLAQALFNDPEVLILDEPTSGLDPNQIVEIRNVIKENGRNKTVIFSTHIMQEVEAICNRVIIINKGKIVKDTEFENIRNLNNELIIQTEMSGDFELDIFKSIPGFKRFEKLDNNKYLFFFTNTTDPRSQIFKIASENGITLLSMQKVENTIEEVFQQLTK